MINFNSKNYEYSNNNKLIEGSNKELENILNIPSSDKIKIKPFTIDNRLSKEIVAVYIKENKKDLENFVKEININNTLDLIDYIENKIKDLYYKSIISLMIKRIDTNRISFNPGEGSGLKNPYKKDMNIDIIQIKALSDLSWIDFNEFLLMTIIHEWNHILFKGDVKYEGNLGYLYGQVKQNHEEENKFEDKYRWFYEKEWFPYQLININEFLTDAISNKDFIEYINSIEIRAIHTIDIDERYNSILDKLKDSLWVEKNRNSVFSEILKIYIITINEWRGISSLESLGLYDRISSVGG